MTELHRLLLDRNENLYGPAPKCFDVLKNLGVQELSCYSRAYTRGVKSRLSERLATELNIPEHQILLSEGSEDMIKQAVHCYVGSGEIVLCPEQSWWYYRSVASEVGGKTITYRLKERDKSFLYDVDEMITMYQRESPRVVLIASPNNPTGNSFPKENLDRLTEAFPESILILDEAYRGFSADTQDQAGEFINHYKNLLILRTFSKLYALAGARIGFAASGSNLSRLTKYASRYLGYNRISEELALAALDSWEYYESIAKQVALDREKYYNLFDQIDGITCYRSDANFIFVRMPPDIKQGLHHHLEQHNIAIKFFESGEFEDCIRITIGTTEQNQRLRNVIGDFFSKHI